MAEIDCGFTDSNGITGSEMLAQVGPTLPVFVGFDIRFWEGQVSTPDLPARLMPALVDTGASNSCIDSTLARELGLPIVDEDTIGGVGGALRVDVHWAQLYVPDLEIGFSGPVAGVHLNEGQQPHAVLIGRDFLEHFTMTYEGKTGSVRISDGGGEPIWRKLLSLVIGKR